MRHAAANFPYLIDPLSAIQGYVTNNSLATVVQSVLTDFNYQSVNQTVSQANACLVFANADSGEGYITVDGNVGDRNVRLLFLPFHAQIHLCIELDPLARWRGAYSHHGKPLC